MCGFNDISGMWDSFASRPRFADVGLYVRRYYAKRNDEGADMMALRK